MSDVVRVLRFLPATVAEGPGRRAALWVQGCSIRCPGCFNPHSWAADGGEPTACQRRRPWVGSDNQRFWFLTPRYRHLAAELGAVPNRLEVRISPSGAVAINGFATVSVLEDLISGDLRTLGRRHR